MLITTQQEVRRGKLIYVYSTNITHHHRGVERREMRYIVDNWGEESNIDAKEYDFMGQPFLILDPLPGREERVRKFIALGRLTNPDFPFKLHPDSE